MAQRPKALDILKGIPGEAADHVLVEGLTQVDPALQSEVVRMLIERGNEVGLTGLPAVFDRLTPPAKSQILANTTNLFAALRNCIKSNDIQTRDNALEIVRQSGNLRLAYLAGIAVHDVSPRIRAEAATTLLSMADKHYQAYIQTAAILQEAMDPTTDMSRVIGHTLQLVREERQYLISTLNDVIQHYENHHRPEVLEAAMLFAHELEDSLFAQSTVKRGQRTHAMLEILHASLAPRYAPFIYVAICYPELRRRLISDLSACRDTDFFVEFIRWHWLARDPVIRKNLIVLRGIAWLNDGFDVAFNLPPDVAVMAPSWLLSLGLPSEQKVSLLKTFLMLDNPRANRAAAYALVDIKTPLSTIALQSLLEHENKALRRIAQCELNYRARTLQHRQSTMPQGRPDPWARLLRAAGLSEDFEDLWQNFERIDPGSAAEAGEHAIKFVPGFMTQIQTKLLSSNSTDKLRALQLIIALRLCNQFQKGIFPLANDSAAEVRALTLKSLGYIGGETSRRILERALNDGVFDVQQAAIEAIDQLAVPHRDELVASKLTSPNASVRAAVVRCLLKMQIPDSATALVSMLHDARADHRYAALCTVDSLKLTTLAGRILDMANCDPDARIARVARHVARRLQSDPTAVVPTEVRS